MIPVSAMEGDNIFKKSNKMWWYKGLTLIDTLDESIIPRTLPLNKPLRGVVQDVYLSEDNQEIIVCKIETGTLKPKKTIVFSPSGKRGVLQKILSFGSTVERAEPGDSVGLVVDGISTIERGEVLSYPETQPKEVKKFTAEVILFSDIQIKKGDELIIRYGTAEKKCKIQRILSEIDPINLTVRLKNPALLKEESVGEVEFLALEPICVEKYSDFPELGRFIIRGRKGTVAAGIILEVYS
jgi:elongation factor 1-alpha